MEVAATGTATYCPEDDKLRLYVGRVPRDEYDFLRAQGWTSTPKQACDFVAVWTPEREDTALAYSPEGIEDEDQTPEERAADRAERFGGYADKRLAEATDHADQYDNRPAVHGYQSRALAERMAARHDRIGTRAVNQWEKAEYWQWRTSGVISHALHIASPGVRMGRIKALEADLRGIEKRHAERRTRWELWAATAAMTDPDVQTARARKLAYIEHGNYTHPRTGRESYLFDLMQDGETSTWPDPLNAAEICALWLASHSEPTPEPSGRWHNHCRLRLAYENQMLEAQGGRAAHVEMVPGGWIGEHQIMKVNKSNATGRVVSVAVKVPRLTSWAYKAENVPGTDYALMTLEVERMAKDVYRPPTEAELAAFEAQRKEEKKARAAIAPKAPPLINPTDEDAERLQAMINDRARKAYDERKSSWSRDFIPATVCRLTQSAYAANSKGSYAKCETREFCAGGEQPPTRVQAIYARSNGKHIADFGPVVCKLRSTRATDKTQSETPDAVRVIVLTDKPQKALPAAIWEKPNESEQVTA